MGQVGAVAVRSLDEVDDEYVTPERWIFGGEVSWEKICWGLDLGRGWCPHLCWELQDSTSIGLSSFNKQNNSTIWIFCLLNENTQGLGRGRSNRLIAQLESVWNGRKKRQSNAKRRLRWIVEWENKEWWAVSFIEKDLEPYEHHRRGSVVTSRTLLRLERMISPGAAVEKGDKLDEASLRIPTTRNVFAKETSKSTPTR